MFNNFCSKLEASKIVRIVLGLFIITGLTVITYHFVDWFKSPLIYIVSDSDSSNTLASSLSILGVEKAKKEYSFETEEFTEKDLNLLNSKLASGFFGDFKKPQLIVLVGKKLQDHGLKWAEKYTDIDFAFLNNKSKYSYPNSEIVNATPYGASYLAGILAGIKTETGKVGIIFDSSIRLRDDYLAGFSQGVALWDGSIKIEAVYLKDNASSPYSLLLLAQKKAGELYDQGYDVLYSVAGKGNSGVINAAEARKEAYVVGTELTEKQLASSPVLAAVYQRLDIGVYQAIDYWFDYGFTGDVTYCGMKHGCSNLLLNPRYKELAPRVMEFKRQAFEAESGL